MLSSVVRKITTSEPGITIQETSLLLGYSRQAYYKRCKIEEKVSEEKHLIKTFVCNIRKRLPLVGTRKIHKLISKELTVHGIKCGRDKLFTLLKELNLLVKPKKRYVQTTYSKHWLRKHPNLTTDFVPKSPEQLWVSDITYLKTKQGNVYLTMITDAYSRKIVGYNVSESMTAEQSAKALKMAIDQRIYPENELIHHSDRGLQYCSSEYVTEAITSNITMSMTETSSPYDNALAERMNRTLKEEFNLYYTLKDLLQVQKVVKEAVDLYNNFRPHLSLNFFTPNDVHKTPQLVC